MLLWVVFLIISCIIMFLLVIGGRWDRLFWGPAHRRRSRAIAQYPAAIDEQLQTQNVTGRHMLQWLQQSSDSPCDWDNAYTIRLHPELGGSTNFLSRRVQLPDVIDKPSMDGLLAVAHEAAHVHQSTKFRPYGVLSVLAAWTTIAMALGSGVALGASSYRLAAVFMVILLFASIYHLRLDVGIETQATLMQHFILSAWLPHSSLATEAQAQITESSQRIAQDQSLWYPGSSVDTLALGVGLTLLFCLVRMYMGAFHF